MAYARESTRLTGSEPRVDERTLRADLMELDDAALVAEYLEGRRHAFHVLAERYQSRLLNFIYRTIGDRDRAEDLVQETFVRVYRHLHRFDPTKKFSTWIYTIASNLAKNELRNRSRSPLVLFQKLQNPRRGYTNIRAAIFRQDGGIDRDHLAAHAQNRAAATAMGRFRVVDHSTG